MAARILTVLLAVVLVTPAYAACPWQKQAAAPECCHKNKSCPKPVKVQPCFECVADVRTAGTTVDQTARAVVPCIHWLPVYFSTVSHGTAVRRDPLPDSSSTYLRIGVLRL
jgi:hypothetical protein